MNKLSETDIDLAKKLIKLIPKVYAHDHDEWKGMGKIICSIDESLLTDFIEFSDGSVYNEHEGCEKLWQKIKCHDKFEYGMSRLVRIIKNIDEKGYNNLIRDRIKDTISKALSSTDDDIANMVHEIYKFDYKCIDISKNIWYEFNGDKWIKVDAGYKLKEKISTNVTREIFYYHSNRLDECFLKSDMDRDELIKAGKQCQKLFAKLKTEKFLNDIMSVCARKFYDDNFRQVIEQSNEYKQLIINVPNNMDIKVDKTEGNVVITITLQKDEI